jgi:hypothetical protein
MLSGDRHPNSFSFFAVPLAVCQLLFCEIFGTGLTGSDRTGFAQWAPPPAGPLQPWLRSMRFYRRGGLVGFPR